MIETANACFRQGPELEPVTYLLSVRGVPGKSFCCSLGDVCMLSMSTRPFTNAVWHADNAACGLQGITAKQAHGELLLLKLVVAGLQQDLRSRLAVYTALCSSTQPEARKRAVVLQTSLLSRILENVSCMCLSLAISWRLAALLQLDEAPNACAWLAILVQVYFVTPVIQHITGEPHVESMPLCHEATSLGHLQCLMAKCFHMCLH